MKHAHPSSKGIPQGFQTRRETARRKGRILIVVLIAAAGLILYGLLRQTAPVHGSGQDFVIPTVELADGQAKFYEYPLENGKKISLFVLKSSDGAIRAAFNACVVCYPRLGYHQAGDAMFCNKCGKRFPSVGISQVSGGCNPVPLGSTVVNDRILIRASDVERGAELF